MGAADPALQVRPEAVDHLGVVDSVYPLLPGVDNGSVVKALSF